jgi:CheY-like chemotaxis protein
VDSRELIAMFLEGCGAEVSAVASADEALEAFAARRPDLVVSDIAMPGKSGYDLIRELRSRPGGRVPAVALTAYAAQEDVQKAMRAGFDAHLAKPVEMGGLARTLADLADGTPKEP